MENKFAIQPVHTAQGQQAIDLILPIQQIEFNVAVTLADQPDLQDIDRYYHQDGGGFWGVQHEGQLIGTIALLAIGHHSGAIRKMFVHKDFRGKEQGIAQQLFETLVRYCREQGITDLYLGTVHVLKAAQRFYERNGFEKIAQQDLPDYFPRMAADDVFYHLHVG